MGLKTALEYGFELLHSFGKEPLTEEMIKLAERFLVRCLSTNKNTATFDELRYYLASLSLLRFTLFLEFNINKLLI